MLRRRKALMLAASMGAAALLAALGKPARTEHAQSQRINLDTLLPRQFGRWQVDETAESFVRPAKLQGKVFQVYDQVLERTFVNPQGQRVMLSAAFGSEQSAGLQMHRPEACYPGGGFKVEGLQSVALTLAGQKVSATRLHAHMPGRSEPITYWMVLGDVVVTDSAQFRLRQLSFSVRRELLDGMLVRLSSIDPTPAQAYTLHGEFADELARALKPEDRIKLIGKGTSESSKGG
jgi:EpsI family protein